MNITQKVLCFQYGYWSLTSTLEDIRRYCMNWYIVKFGGSQEDAADFFSYLCPRVIRTLYTYKFEGKSYLHYLKRLLHFQVKTYWKTNRRDLEKQEQIVSLLQDNYQVIYDGARPLIGTTEDLWPESDESAYQTAENSADDIYCCETSPTVIQKRKTATEIDEEEIQQAVHSLPSQYKHLLLSALQRTVDLGDEIIARLSEHTGISKLHLLAFRQEAFTMIASKVEKRNIMRDRRTRNLMRLRFSDEIPAVQKRLKTYLSRNWARAQNMNTTPSHVHLAEVTGLPKGTIGSNLYRKNKNDFRRISDP